VKWRIALFSCLVVLLIAVVWFAVPPASAQTPNYPNGDFNTNLLGWNCAVLFSVGNGCVWNSIDWLGNTGSARVNSGFGIATLPFYPSGTYLEFHFKCNSGNCSFEVVQIDYSAGSTSVVYSGIENAANGWVSYSSDNQFASLSFVPGRLYGLQFSAVNGAFYIDHIILYGTIATFPYGLSTPMPVIVNNFPTSVPYPTFPPFPTAISNVTNNNTTNNTTNNYGSSGSGTTIVISGNATVMAFPYGAGTPVPVSRWYDATPRPTMVSMNSWGGTQANRDSGAGALNYNFNPSTVPNLVLDPSAPAPAFSDLFGLNFVGESWDFDLLPSSLASQLNMNPIRVELDYIRPVSLMFAGIDILPWLYGLGAAWIFAMVLQFIRKR